MAGRVHLGTEGDAAAADVLAAWEVGSGFECCAVVSEYPAALAELKARLQEKSERLYTLEPDARFREDGLHALAAKLAMAKTRAVVWLEQDPFDEAGWRSACLPSTRTGAGSVRSVRPCSCWRARPSSSIWRKSMRRISGPS